MSSGGAPAAEHAEEAVRELVRKIAAFAGPREAIALNFRTVAPAAPADATRVRRAVEAGLREAGVRLDPAAGVEVRVALSETRSARLLVGDAHRGEERQTWIVSWPPAAAGAGPSGPGVRLERKLLWEQAAPILDAALVGDSLLVLSPDKLARCQREGGVWREKETAAIALPRPWPRDPRGRLAAGEAGVRAFLPGAVCTGALSPALTLDCKAADEPWPLDSGGRYLLLAHYTAARNHFDGRVVTQNGSRRTLAPFYTAAAVEEAGEALWVTAGLDGRALLLDRSFAQAGVVGDWGSDIAGAGARCAGVAPVVATRPGEDNEALEAFSIAGRQAAPLSAPLPMPGPVTALWPAPEGVLAVTRDPSMERYAAYLVTLVCGR
jgi:hypothetical protein